MADEKKSKKDQRLGVGLSAESVAKVKAIQASVKAKSGFEPTAGAVVAMVLAAYPVK